MPNYFDSDAKTAKDYGLYYNEESDQFDTIVDISINDENGMLSLMFENEHHKSLFLELPPTRLKALLDLL